MKSQTPQIIYLFCSDKYNNKIPCERPIFHIMHGCGKKAVSFRRAREKFIVFEIAEECEKANQQKCDGKTETSYMCI